MRTLHFKRIMRLSNKTVVSISEIKNWFRIKKLQATKLSQFGKTTVIHESHSLITLQNEKLIHWAQRNWFSRKLTHSF